MGVDQMEQIRKFLQGRGFALALIACLLAAGAAAVWAVNTLRGELEKGITDLVPESTAPPTASQPEIYNREEEELWLDLTQEAANSTADVPLPGSAAPSSSSGGGSGSGTVSEPSALASDSAPAAGSAAAAWTPPFPGRVLKGYSGDELVYSTTLGDWRTHNGIDYACAAGDTVSAPVSGRVTAAGNEDSWGGVVSIEDSAGRLWRLCGVAKPTVSSGDTVTPGQPLGVADTIGCECAEESHIHLEVLQGSAYLDPAAVQ